MIRTDMLASAQIISKNPILMESTDIKRKYFAYLKKYIYLGNWERRKYVKAQLHTYSKLLIGNENFEIGRNKGLYGMLGNYQYLLLMDIVAILGYQKELLLSEEMKKLKHQIIVDFNLNQKEQQRMNDIFRALSGETELWKELKKDYACRIYKDYIKCIEMNQIFMSREPYRILITATMSAGKSTLINALTGKDICSSQNMACTSKINLIIGKAYEDGFSYEYDSVQNKLKKDLYYGKKVLSTYYNGLLGGDRLVIYDSPGVNFSGNSDHKKITEDFIVGKEYDCLIYLMNATQLGTVDDDRHLDFVKQHIGRKRIIFVINKIDTFNPDEEDVGVMLERQVKRLKEKGFKNPVVCMVSAKAAFLAKKSQNEQLKCIESRELYSYIDQFEEMTLKNYYEKYYQGLLIPDNRQEENRLLKNCGITYLEKIIDKISKGEEINGTGTNEI